MLCLAQLQYNYWIVMPKTSYTYDLLLVYILVQLKNTVHNIIMT